MPPVGWTPDSGNEGGPSSFTDEETEAQRSRVSPKSCSHTDPGLESAPTRPVPWPLPKVQSPGALRDLRRPPARHHPSDPSPGPGGRQPCQPLLLSCLCSCPWVPSPHTLSSRLYNQNKHFPYSISSPNNENRLLSPFVEVLIHSLLRGPAPLGRHSRAERGRPGGSSPEGWGTEVS